MRNAGAAHKNNEAPRSINGGDARLRRQMSLSLPVTSDQSLVTSGTAHKMMEASR